MIPVKRCMLGALNQVLAEYSESWTVQYGTAVLQQGCICSWSSACNTWLSQAHYSQRAMQHCVMAHGPEICWLNVLAPGEELLAAGSSLSGSHLVAA